MPYDGSGVFNPLITFIDNTLATAEDQNAQDGDIASGLTNCITRDGQSVMEANLNMGGFKVTGLAPGTAGTDAVNVSQLSGGPSPIAVPIGTVLDYAGSSPPTGYMICDGSAISRTTYSALFLVTGTAYGVGDGTTTFNIPDTRGRTVAAVDPTGTVLTSATMTPDGNTLGATGGAQTHALVLGELAAHTHTAASISTSNAVVTDPGHFHGNNAACANLGAVFAPGVAVSAGNVTSAATLSATTGITVAVTTGTTTTNSTTGMGTAHLNMQPTLLMSKIIKVQ